MPSNSIPYQTAPLPRNDSIKSLKNNESKGFAFDAQRLHRIHLRTVELLNQHFQRIDHKSLSQERQDVKKPAFSKFQQLRNRFFSLKSQNQQQIAQQMKQVKLIYKGVFRSEQLKEMEQKLRRVKTTSSTLDQEIKLYEQQLIEERKDLNLEGNDWIEMKMNTKIKKEWKKRNQNEVKEYKGNSNNTFFHRKLTTDFQTQKKRRISNIKKLRLQSSDPSKKHSSSQARLSIAELLPANQISSYERQNQFVKRVLNQNRGRGSSLQGNKQNLRRSKLIQSHEDQKRGNEGWGVILQELSKFQDRDQLFINFKPGEKPGLKPKTRKSSDKGQLNQQKNMLKLDRKWPENTKQNNPSSSRVQNAIPCDKIAPKSIFHEAKSRDTNFSLAKDKSQIHPSKQTRKLVL